VLGHLVFGYLFARAAWVALQKAGSADPFYASKLATARFYFARLLPEADYNVCAARAGSRSLSQLEGKYLFL
jgi:3-(methylsulfanyl)propanoyl-CoA dehydrogenase